MNKFKTVAAGILASAMILSLTACDEEPAVSGSNASNSGVPNSDANAVVTTANVTTTKQTDKAVEDAAKEAAVGLDNPDLDVTKRIKWMAWNNWELDETSAAGAMFREVYGIPETGDDPTREGRIIEYIDVPYLERYDKLANAIASGDSPDLFPFELRDFPYGVIKGRYQPVDEILNLEGPKWDAARDVMDQFKIAGRYYCAVYEISFDNLMYYRTSVIEGAGLDDPRTLFDNDEWTWDAFLEMAREFQKSGDNKYALDGYSPDKDLVLTNGTPIIGNDGGKLVNNLRNANVERGIDLLATLAEENLRYPRHEVNNWNINPKAWAAGDILFFGDGGDWVFQSTLSLFAQKFGWADDEIKCVPFPRDPQADKYYQYMKQDALMWCKGSTNKEGVAAWIDCSITASLDPAAREANKQKQKAEYNWSDYNLDFIYAQCALDGTSKLTPIFDFKNGIGEDIASAGTTDSPVEQLTQYVYIKGESYTQIRETNFATIDARINEINEFIANM